MFNWAMYHTLVEACEQRGLEIKYTQGTCSVQGADWPARIILWTPLNKMPRYHYDEHDLLGDEYWRRELTLLEMDSVRDFHLELFSNNLEVVNAVSTVCWWRGMDTELAKNPSVEQWFKIMDFVSDQHQIDTEYFLYRLQESPEEATS